MLNAIVKISALLLCILFWVAIWGVIKSHSQELYTCTAYCPCVKCCGKTDGITASGVKAKEGRTIACNHLPFGTKVVIDGHTYAVEDRGSRRYFGTMKRKVSHIDIFFNKHSDAIKYGKRFKQVEVIK